MCVPLYWPLPSKCCPLFSILNPAVKLLALSTRRDKQVITAFIGNMLSKPDVVSWFLIYFMVVGFVVLLVFLRVRLLKILLKFAGPVCLGEHSGTLC